MSSCRGFKHFHERGDLPHIGEGGSPDGHWPRVWGVRRSWWHLRCLTKARCVMGLVVQANYHSPRLLLDQGVRQQEFALLPVRAGHRYGAFRDALKCCEIPFELFGFSLPRGSVIGGSDL